MPWYNGDYPPSYKNQPENVREKAVEIANALLEEGAEEGVAIATGLKQARQLIENYADDDIKPVGKSVDEATDPTQLSNI